MAIVPYPALPQHQVVELQPITGAFINTSVLSHARQANDLGYSWWVASVTVAAMEIASARAWRLFFGRLRGPVHKFRVPVVSAPQHSGSFTARAQGTGSGYSLVTDGWPASTTPLLGGDYVTVGDQLMVLDADVNVDAAGVANLQFHSPLRGTVADNTVITTKWPFLMAYLPEGSPALALNTAQLQEGFGYSAIEAY